jgi:hypothetical protein
MMTGMPYAFERMLSQLDIRPDSKFYCQIYQAKIRAEVDTTSDYDKEEEAVAEAKEKIRYYQTMNGQL